MYIADDTSARKWLRILSTGGRVLGDCNKLLSVWIFLGCIWLWTPLVVLAADTTLNFKGADINAVIQSVADITGKNFIVDPRVKGKVTIISKRPMSQREIYQVFLTGS